MSTETKTTFRKVAEEARQLFERVEAKSAEDAPKYAFKLDVIQSNDRVYRAISDALYSLDGISHDSAYRFAVETLDLIEDADDEDEAERMIEEMEPDVYTSSLTEWLNEHNAHVYYMTQAAEEYGTTDGFNQLQVAQKLCMEEVAREILEAVKEVAEEREEGAE